MLYPVPGNQVPVQRVPVPGNTHGKEKFKAVFKKVIIVKPRRNDESGSRSKGRTQEDSFHQIRPFRTIDLNTMTCRLLIHGILSSALLVSGVIGDGTDLGGGIVTTTNVDRFATLPLDLKDMQDYITNGQTNEAINVYMNGKNSPSAANGGRLSLKSLSTELADRDFLNSKIEPSFLFQLYGLSGRSNVLNELVDKASYANGKTLFYLNGEPAKASESIVALNMWMYAMHLLYDGVDKCYMRTSADDPDFITLGGGGMDEFIGLWISSEQKAATSDGYSLYAMAQEAGNKFGTASPEANVNSRLKLLYEEAKTVLSFPNACSNSNEDTTPQLWGVAQRMISQATIPLMQNLIAALLTKDTALADIYSTALVPLTSQCRSSVYKRLKDDLLRPGSIDFSKTEDIIADLQEMYNCLGFTCDDVGEFSLDGMTIKCVEQDLVPLAEFAPSMNVKHEAMIDLDVMQVTILTQLESHQFAKYLYLYGRSSPIPRMTENDPYRLLSLHTMATSSVRVNAGHFYSSFSEYHNNIMYSNNVVLDTLNGEGKYGSKPAEYKAVIVGKTIQYQIIFMYAIAEMAHAVEQCKQRNLDGEGGSKHGWDQVAAYLIGSMEGPTRGGSSDLEDGQMFWNLANQQAYEFQENVLDEGYARINAELENMLYAGLGELEASNCQYLEDTSDRIQHLMLIPLIQATLSYAIVMEDEPSTYGTRTVDFAAGETFALSVLPEVAAHDKVAAEFIAEEMVTDTPKIMVPRGAQAVADAFFGALDDFGYTCDLVGATTEVDACKKAGGIKKVTKTHNAHGGFIAGIVIAVIVLGANITFCFLRKKEKNQALAAKARDNEESEQTPPLLQVIDKQNQDPEAQTTANSNTPSEEQGTSGLLA